MSLPSLRRRLILTLSGAGLLLLVIISLLMVVAEDKMEELSLRHWLEAEVTRYSDDWLRLGMAAPPPARVSFPATGPRPRLPVWLKPYQSPGFYEHVLGTRTSTSWCGPIRPVRGCSIWCSTTMPTTTWILTRISCTWRPG